MSSQLTAVPPASIAIDAVHPAADDHPEAVGFRLDHPHVGEIWDGYVLRLGGWILTRTGPPAAVELWSRQVGIRSFAVDRPRADIGAAFPATPGSDRCGFFVATTSFGLPREFELHLYARLESGRRIFLARIEGRRGDLGVETRDALAPLLVTTIGRAGSSWLVQLLGAHRETIAYAPFKHEPRALTYWLEVSRTLSDPGSVGRILSPNLASGEWWLPDADSTLALERLEPEVRHALESATTRNVLESAVRSIDGFYRAAAEVEDKRDARYFVEKVWPNFVPDLALDLYENAAELFLVRDPRDVFCSILAFNERRGYASFGREMSESDEDFIRLLRAQNAALLESWRTRSARSHLVRYEDLVEDPVETLSAIFEAVGVDCSPAAVERALSSTELVPADVQDGHRTSPSTKASVGRWRRDLSPSLARALEESLAEILEEFDYA
jgi:Sulfotransferase family